MSNYKRVIPRDFFNESKLLKCFGALLIESEKKNLQIRFSETSVPFDVCQDQSDGSLYLANYTAWNGNRPLHLSIPYNSKEAYPLFLSWLDHVVPVFNENGTLTQEFIAELTND